MREKQTVWLVAHYHFPATYSCRIPLSSISSAQASPGPGPATVRLALIKAGCELSGSQYMQHVLFPVLRAAPVCIRPPERVAFSQQIQRLYKGRSSGQTIQIVESVGFREVAQAQGLLTVYVQVPVETTDDFRESLKMIGYWGQTDSFATCIAIEEAAPVEEECVLPLRALPWRASLGAFFSCILTEFRHINLSWEDVIPGEQVAGEDPFWRELYVWPMLLAERRAENKLLVRKPFNEGTSSDKQPQKEVDGETVETTNSKRPQTLRWTEG
ncbi:MAG TPA: hypothetical protein VKT82_04205 [Ktedonobacterales bacterium]|nr:hypothetical protein [Ktedonobacterales bacterium]